MKNIFKRKKEIKIVITYRRCVTCGRLKPNDIDKDCQKCYNKLMNN